MTTTTVETQPLVSGAKTRPQGTSVPNQATVTAVTHWSDRLFSFKVERPDALRFRSGEFVMLGLMQEKPGADKPRPLLRAYSIASPAWEEELEFYSIKVPDGPLTSRLQHLDVGDSIILRTRPVGTLVLDALLPGKRLWLLSTGTGIAPFLSLIREPETYEKYESVILMHTCRHKVELEFGKTIVDEVLHHELLGELASGKLVYHPATTREAENNGERITDALESGSIVKALGIEPMDTASDRFMMCGSLGFNKDMQRILGANGFVEGSNSEPGHYVIEKAFVD